MLKYYASYITKITSKLIKARSNKFYILHGKLISFDTIHDKYNILHDKFIFEYIT